MTSKKLLGDINWLQTYLKLTTGDLKPLFDLLQGDSNHNSPGTITPEGREAINKVKQAIQSQFVTFIDYTQPLALIIYQTTFTPTAVFWQKAPIMWVHLHASPAKTIYPYYQAVADIIFLGREQSIKYFCKDPDTIIQPYTIAQVNWFFQTTDCWPIACASYSGQIDNHYPNNKLFHFISTHNFVFPLKTSLQPTEDALLIFTDGSSSGIAAYVVNNEIIQFQTHCDSAQITELQAVVAVFSAYPARFFNLYTDSAYIAQSVPLLETAAQIKNASQAACLFVQLQSLIQNRTQQFFIGHLRAHTNLPGPLFLGNQLADQTPRVAYCANIILNNHLPDLVTKAIKAHKLHHLNARTLRLMFHNTREQACQIVKQCPGCITHLPTSHLGVNPRGLVPNALWQMDVTHIPEFSNLKYVHVSINTFSGFIFATPQTGEAGKQIIAHMLAAMAALGTPQHIKTDDSPGYTGQMFTKFCQQLQIKHTTGIPYNPQGQGIVERANLSLKNTIKKIKKGGWYPTKKSPRNLITKPET
ncbi:dynein regulatory complex protein 9 isoform X1 [Tamandua tetradactyla]|uniref:dynein regulatory complex protein 9 isoform X1 n=1 Tax=Tamandua tetradactyla TaxID=48850 RepID=UPI0040540EF6